MRISRDILLFFEEALWAEHRGRIHIKFTVANKSHI